MRGLALILAGMALLSVTCGGHVTPAPSTPSPHTTTTTAPTLEQLPAARCRAVWQDTHTAASLQQAIRHSRAALQRQPATRTVPLVDRTTTVGALLHTAERLLNLLDDPTPPSPAVLCRTFQLARVATPRGLLVTGYYQPELHASRIQSPRFSVPLYRPPADLQTRQPYFTRAEIDAGALETHGEVLAWVDDPIDAFFLHIQGSGILRLQDGNRRHIGFAASNGRPYTSIGATLLASGAMAPGTVSLDTLKAYLRAHPTEQSAIFTQNERYIFFREVTDGPRGSMNVPLTAERSVAADPTVYPAGLLAFLHLFPRPGVAEAIPPPRLVTVQDTGSAIIGAGRLDVYWGSGTHAGRIAGQLQHPGELYVLLPQSP